MSYDPSAAPGLSQDLRQQLVPPTPPPPPPPPSRATIAFDLLFPQSTRPVILLCLAGSSIAVLTTSLALVISWREQPSFHPGTWLIVVAGVVALLSGYSLLRHYCAC